MNFDDPELYETLANPQHENHKNVKRFLEAIGICHTVITENKKTENKENFVQYNASSPDELAIVNGARHLGFAF